MSIAAFALAESESNFFWFIAIRNEERPNSGPGIVYPFATSPRRKSRIVENGTIEPYENWRLPVETRVNDLLGRMTTEEKAFQMFYNAQTFPLAGWHFGPAQAPDLHAALLASSGTRLGIPFISAGDTIAGYGTTYPLQSALAAARNYELDYRLGDMFAPHIDKTEPLSLVCRSFRDAVLSGVPPRTGGREGLEVVRILEAAEASIRKQGEPVFLEPRA